MSSVVQVVAEHAGIFTVTVELVFPLEGKAKRTSDSEHETAAQVAAVQEACPTANRDTKTVNSMKSSRLIAGPYGATQA
jgi:hypothetical protein